MPGALLVTHRLVYMCLMNVQNDPYQLFAQAVEGIGVAEDLQGSNELPKSLVAGHSDNLRLRLSLGNGINGSMFRFKHAFRTTRNVKPRRNSWLRGRGRVSF